MERDRRGQKNLGGYRGADFDGVLKIMKKMEGKGRESSIREGGWAGRGRKGRGAVSLIEGGFRSKSFGVERSG